MVAPHDTPVDMPAVVNAKKSKQQLAWEAQAAQYKADGYNASVVARKMIDDHGMPDAEAEQLVGELFGKKVNARGGETSGAIATGLMLLAAGLIGCVVLYLAIGFMFIKFTGLVYLALLGVAGKGASQAFIAMVNAGTKTPLHKE